MGLTQVTAAGLTADLIDETKLADNSLDSEHYNDGSVDQAHLADEAINEAKLQISNAGTNGQFLSKQSGNTGGLTWANASTIAQNTQGSSYTLVAGDAGKHILASGNITIPNSVFAAGDGVVIVNNTSGDLTITSGITNLYLGTDGSTGNKTLASRCTCTVLFTSGTAGYISGGGLS